MLLRVLECAGGDMCGMCGLGRECRSAKGVSITGSDAVSTATEQQRQIFEREWGIQQVERRPPKTVEETERGVERDHD